MNGNELRQKSVTRITTMLGPDERLRVDAAGIGIFRAMHRDSVEEMIRDLRERGASAVVLSTAYCDERAAGRVASVVREFPRVPAVAILSQLVPGTAQTVLTLGRSGVRTLIDVRTSTGWRELRDILLNDRTSDVHQRALAHLSLDLVALTPGGRRFFEVLFNSAWRICTVRALSDALGVVPSTLMSRFFRARLPAPKRYLAMARLSCAAQLFENSGLSIASVANQLDYSSPQSFGRHVRMLLRLTAVEFRERYDGDGMLQRFRDDLILPYTTALRTFDPLAEYDIRKRTAVGRVVHHQR